MKKKIVSALLISTMAVGALAGCGGGDDSSASNTTPGSQQSADNADDGASASSGGSGTVYLLNFKPETDGAWQDLAATYTDQTGVTVNVLTAADGQYKATLQSELAKSEAPTIFNIGATADCAEYADYIYDLKDSDI